MFNDDFLWKLASDKLSMCHNIMSDDLKETQESFWDKSDYNNHLYWMKACFCLRVKILVRSFWVPARQTFLILSPSLYLYCAIIIKAESPKINLKFFKNKVTLWDIKPKLQEVANSETLRYNHNFLYKVVVVRYKVTFLNYKWAIVGIKSQFWEITRFEI